ncbi:hypothetical protein [Bacillus sp. FJAT-49736]|nr:hypothetical protein [Bacillus sp. FJAT-49736]MBS4172290.1 hypothetical protein [Bacillus sp. FJAT-49736]
MSSKDGIPFDFADFWISYLNGPEDLYDDLNEMDEYPISNDNEQTTTYKG